MRFPKDLRHGVPLACLFLVAGCCDKQVLERCRVETQERLNLLEKPSVESEGLLRFDIRAIADAKIEIGVVNASCVAGKGGAAEVKVDWQVASPAVRGVRAQVGTGDSAQKVWVESGPAGGGVTGPWIQDGARIELRDAFGGGVLGEIRVVGLPCGGT